MSESQLSTIQELVVVKSVGDSDSSIEDSLDEATECFFWVKPKDRLNKHKIMIIMVIPIKV